VLELANAMHTPIRNGIPIYNVCVMHPSNVDRFRAHWRRTVPDIPGASRQKTCMEFRVLHDNHSICDSQLYQRRSFPNLLTTGLEILGTSRNYRVLRIGIPGASFECVCYALEILRVFHASNTV